ncbi:MAG: hypothetical protein KF830_06965 [Planctomycetes bacterium]|nr:hypothetical protein [Planctomycetota bacterium]
MRRRTAGAMAWCLLAAACGGDASAAAAGQALADFQAALQRGDRQACRDLLTLESQVAVDHLPWHDLDRRQPLEVLGAERCAGEFVVHVRDPNDGGRPSTFVVVREHGRLVVDLVATAGRHAETIEAAGAVDQFEPRELTPADFDRIRLHELAQPPR